MEANEQSRVPPTYAPTNQHWHVKVRAGVRLVVVLNGKLDGQSGQNRPNWPAWPTPNKLGMGMSTALL
jgi:hypothetical protein